MARAGHFVRPFMYVADAGIYWLLKKWGCFLVGIRYRQLKLSLEKQFSENCGGKAMLKGLFRHMETTCVLRYPK